MSEHVDRLMLQFLEWVGGRPRTYGEAMDAWRTSCPRLSVWEDALAGDLIRIGTDAAGAGAPVSLTPRGQAVLSAGQTAARGEGGLGGGRTC